MGIWILIGAMMSAGALLNLEAMSISELASDYAPGRWRALLPLPAFCELLIQAGIGFFMVVTAWLGRRGSARARECLHLASWILLGLLTVFAYMVFLVWFPSLDRRQAFYALRIALAAGLFSLAYAFLIVSIVVFGGIGGVRGHSP
jgi:hypothetical protein